MTEPPTPLKIDLRTLLEALASMLVFLLSGTATVDLGDPWQIVVPLIVGAAIIGLNRLLGRAASIEVQVVTVDLNRKIAENTILAADATPTVARAAVAAGDALVPAKVVVP